jgi:N-acetylglucosamine-6-phosphate deacetylase
MRIHARHYATADRVEIVWTAGRIESVRAPLAEPADLEADWVAPAFFDLQINGCGGHSFNSGQLTLQAIRRVVATCRQHGIAALCPTLITNSFAELAEGFTVLQRAREGDPILARALPAFHLEGPWISAEDGPRGAHPRRHVRPPDLDEFRRLQDAAGGRIRLVTLAPEHDGALRFIESLSAEGVVVALGHTAAEGDCIRDAIRAGARLSTHLGNGAHAVLPRHPNYLWDQLAADELQASIICDGHHLPPSVVRCIVRAKTPARIILTCDTSSLAGLPPGRYSEWEQELEVRADGRIDVAGTPYLAGSGVFTEACVGKVIAFAGVTLPEAVEMAGNRPRELLGLESVELRAGAPADLVLFDWEPGEELSVVATLCEGAMAFGSTC